jgi:uncharacterized integral membrane protein (TIGR00697 family)
MIIDQCSDYKVLGFKDSGTRATIMILSTGKTFDIWLRDLIKSEIMDKLSRQEIQHIFRRHYARESTTTAYELHDRHETSWMVYTGLNILLLLLFVFTGIAATKLVYLEWLDIIVTPGLFLYPLTFLIVDMLNEAYGLKLARKAIFFAFAGNAAIILLLAVSTLLPGLPNWALDASYSEVIKHISTVLVASSISFVVSEYINSYLLCKIKELTQSRFLFLRVFLSTLCAVILDSLLFCFIAFYGSLDNSDILKMVYVQITIKVILAFFNILPAYGARALFRRYLPVSHPA